MIARIWSLVVKEIIHLRRDPWMPMFMLFGGVLELLIVGLGHLPADHECTANGD